MAQQIKKKFIKDNAIDGTKIKILEGQSLRGEKHDGTEIDLLKLSDGVLVHDDMAIVLDHQLYEEKQNRIAGDVQVQNNLDAEISRAISEESRIESKFDEMIDSEEAARIAGDNYLQAELDAEKLIRSNADANILVSLEEEVLNREYEILRISGLLTEEEEQRIAADYDLQSKVDVQKGRIDAILLASDADKDTFAEIVELINSVDTENDSAFASYVLSNNAALASEVSSREQGDQDLQDSIDSEEARAISEESRIESKFNGMIASEEAARIAGDFAEQTRAMSVEYSLQSQITQEVSDRQSAIFSEASARQSADQTLQSNIDAEKTRAMGIEAYIQAQHDNLDGYTQDIRTDLDNLDGYAQDIRTDLDQEIVDRVAAVSAEASARQSADLSLQASLDSEISRAQFAESTEQAARIAGDAFTLQSSKDYTDGKISLVMSNLDTEALDSLVEIVTAFQNADGSINQAISNLSSAATSALAAEQAARIAEDEALQSNIDAEEARAIGVETELQYEINALESVVQSNFELQQTDIDELRSDVDTLSSSLYNETAAREAADQDLESRIEALEVQTDGPYFEKQKFVIDESSELSSIKLSYECMENSLVVCVGRLMVHKDEDYSVSVVNGKTVLTWMGDFAQGEIEGIEESDVIFVTFARSV